MYLFYMKLIQLFRCLLNINILFIKHVGNDTLEYFFQGVFCLRFVQQSVFEFKFLLQTLRLEIPGEMYFLGGIQTRPVLKHYHILPHRTQGKPVLLCNPKSHVCCVFFNHLLDVPIHDGHQFKKRKKQVLMSLKHTDSELRHLGSSIFGSCPRKYTYGNEPDM